MSDQPTITIEVNGRSLQAKPGQMLIEVTDGAGVTVPRFCYHKKLSISANCRMCLVEVENAPKPLPACATPVADGMKVYTNSPLARDAQKGTMEFLLINHPLDCPICDQGGECELQDLAMGYGSGISRFVEGKRVVVSDDLGPLVATDMTRCIHCTRCVRFGEEIAGVREMGATGRGEHTRIGVFIKHSMSSELSGNIIDLCPVGALTSKPFRYRARAWEMTQYESIAPHDGFGSNVYLHVRNHQVMRVVPRDNEQINETWISDRDRFSYQGLYADDRLRQPMMRVDGELQAVDWQAALLKVAETFNKAPHNNMGALISPNATLEEMHLLRRLLDGVGCQNRDHRLRQVDTRGDIQDPALPWLGQSYAKVERNQVTLLIGSWLRKDQPLLNHRVRKSVLAGGQVMAINPIDYDFNYELTAKRIVAPAQMLSELAAVAKAVGADTLGLEAVCGDEHEQIAAALQNADQGLILLGSVAHSHPDFSLLRQLASNICEKTAVDLGFATDGANALGARLSGLLPGEDGMTASQMLETDLQVSVLFNLEPEFDVANPQQMEQLLNNSTSIVFSTHMSPWMEKYADVLLPIASFAETSGTYINQQGEAQSFNGAAKPAGESRPGWKVLRVLGTLLDLKGFEFDSSAEVRDEALAVLKDTRPDNKLTAAPDGAEARMQNSEWQRVGGAPIYTVDMLTRRSSALQRTPDAWKPGIYINAGAAQQLGVIEGDLLTLSQQGGSLTLPVILDSRVPDQSVWLPEAVPGSEQLAAGFGRVSLEKA